MSYICTVFFMVLDLRLMKIGCLGRYPSFFVYVSHHFLLPEQKKNEAKRKFAVCIFSLLQYFSPLNKKHFRLTVKNEDEP